MICMNEVIRCNNLSIHTRQNLVKLHGLIEEWMSQIIIYRFGMGQKLEIFV